MRLLLGTCAFLLIALAGGPVEAEARRAEVIQKMADLLETRYVDEAGARRLSGMLREAAKDGRFDSHVEADAFAQAVTTALRETVPDLHLLVTYEPAREFVPGAGPDRQVERRGEDGSMRQVVRTGRVDGRSRDEIAKTNFGIDRVELLEGGIGYLQISQFVPLDMSRNSLQEAFSKLTGSKAVIVDLRGTRGGHPQTVGYVLSHFFARERSQTPLHVAENRALGIRSEVRTDPELSRPGLVVVPLFVLVDARTASAAEMFATAARSDGRASIIGEVTRGAGNGAVKHSAGEGFALQVPEWRVVNGPGWEGVGVKPDVAVPGTDALETALSLARSSAR